MNQSRLAEEFEDLLVACQGKLLAYIYALLPNMNDAQDILQQTVLKLWEEFEHYDRDQTFAGWAHTLARYQVLSFLRDKQRSRVVFNDDVMTTLSDRQAEMAQHDDADAYREALSHCESRLEQSDRRLLRRCYVDEVNVALISTELGRSPQSVCNSLKRIRTAMFGCIQRRLSKQEQS